MATLADIQRAVGVPADGKIGPVTLAAIANAIGLSAPRPRALQDAEAFFSTIRRPLFAGSLSQPQVDGLTQLLAAMGAAGWSVAWAAYGLATAYHETAKTMAPVREAYWLSEEWRRKNLRYYPHYGRGYVQLTWPANYARVDRDLDLRGALIADPDLALRPDIAAQVLVRGMTEGWFSEGHSLAIHLPVERAALAPFTAARAIINGSDRAADVAGIALLFQDALSAGGWA
ncbi:hypothetical protein ACMT1E_04280 [Sphingomonas flavalba]|uniref:hypothetical protein n=1 Tax=Sphingomonas flavalba TaxID=2559804 RepID=UPI0039DFE035